ncbi:polymorphic toxin-type HINT domain-containing protein [Synechococcus sp. PCC 7336]|uniref:polymorphic toxin-type HINT domain-containing protein n=1 Tax=Synechococcus sp. PCC 7336 TaxID=195250 RepID=UPI001D0D7BE7|nr:polymorphic toxin-type HINT domain-containing protein [Synechococcus sp. PCC 7336]
MAFGRRTGIELPEGDRASYSYDANGNLLNRTSSINGTTQFDWNDSNRLVGVLLPNGDEISYVYDTAGIQVSSTINGETTTYVIDSNRPFAQVLESITSDDLVQISVFGLDLIAQLQGDQSSFFHTDGLGSTRVVTDGEGTVQQEFDYLAFGELLGARNAEQVDNLFAGEQFEQELGLYYLRQRYYDPSTGRFISRDAFEGFITDPISQNRYLYANANPVTYTDPSGFFSIGNVSAASVARGTLSVISSPQFLLGAGIGAGAQVTSDFARGERSTVLGVLGAAAFGGLGFVFGPALAGALLKSAIGTVGLSLLVANGLADSFNTLRAGLSSGDPLRAFAGVTSALLDFGLLDGALNPRSLLRNPLRGARGFARSIGGLSDNIARQGGDLVDNIIGNILDGGRNAADNALDGASPTRPDTIQCFVAGTAILTPQGKTDIDRLRPGDWVIAWDEETGEVSQRQVTEWYERQAPVIIDLFIGTEKISCTPEHPFWVKGRGWVRASQLTVGAVLQTRAGKSVSIDAVHKRDETTNIYNVEIDGLHTYFVSDLEILSHNMCGGSNNAPDGSSSGIPGIDRPFRSENPDFPANSQIKDLFDDPNFQDLVNTPGCDCSEIAEVIASASGTAGEIITFQPRDTSPFATIAVPESIDGVIVPQDFVYHTVFTDGRFVYDPRLSNNPIPLGDYNRLINRLNPGNIRIVPGS